MALTKCKECGEQVSTKAEACPKCGAKVRKKTSAFTWLMLGFVILVVYGMSTAPSPSTSSTSTQTSPRASQVSTSVMEPAWGNTSAKDEMTGERSSYATSPTVLSKSPMSFPYQGTKAWIGAGCNKTGEWAFIGFTQAPNLNDTEIGDGYNTIRTRVKWNDKVEDMTLTQKWGDSFLHFVDDTRAISRISSSTSVVVELDWHGQQPVYFELPLRGSSSALSLMRSECAT